MIKKLRRKFIFINMLFVVIILLVVFGWVCISTANRLDSDLDMALSQAVSMKGFNDKGRPEFEPHPDRPNEKDNMKKSEINFILAHIVDIDNNGNITEPFNNRLLLSDEELGQAITYVLAADTDRGNIRELSLRYQKHTHMNGTRIALADNNYYTSSMQAIVMNSLFVGVFAISGFFVLSWFLSRLALKPVERAWTQQKQFVADVSHELKTPLTVILANLNLLSAYQQDTIQNQMRWIKSADDEARHMKKLVEDMLVLASSDESESAIVLSPVGISDCVFAELLQIEPIAYENGIELTEEIEDSLFVAGDDLKIRQLVKILLDNACKYSKGQVRVRLYQNQRHIILGVENTGVIDKDDLEHIFDRFYRGDKARSNNDSFGLGLSIADSIVRRLGGKISAHVENGRTIFRVELRNWNEKSSG